MACSDVYISVNLMLGKRTIETDFKQIIEQKLVELQAFVSNNNNDDNNNNNNNNNINNNINNNDDIIK